MLKKRLRKLIGLRLPFFPGPDPAHSPELSVFPRQVSRPAPEARLWFHDAVSDQVRYEDSCWELEGGYSQVSGDAPELLWPELRKNRTASNLPQKIRERAYTLVHTAQERWPLYRPGAVGGQANSCGTPQRTTSFCSSSGYAAPVHQNPGCRRIQCAKSLGREFHTQCFKVLLKKPL